MEDSIKKLYVEASSRCNLACKMCFRHSWIDEGFGDLDMAVFERLLDDPALSETETVFFGGMGEPLVHPQIIDMVALASKHKKSVEIITNGTLLDQNRCKALLNAGLKRLWVSVDEIYENYAKIQKGGSFDKVLSHLNNFNRMRIGTDVRLGMTAVIMRDNIKSLSKIKDFAEQCKADDLNLSHMIPNRAEDEPQTLWNCCDNTVPVTGLHRSGLIPFQWRIDSVKESDLAYGDSSGQEIPMFSFYNCYKKELLPDEEGQREAELFSWKGSPVMRRLNYCRFIEEGHCFVRWDADVAPCMGLLHSSVTYLNEQKRTVWRHSFGNLKQQSLSEIWNSAEYFAFRERVRSFSFSPCISCGGCDLRAENKADCTGNHKPVCGACLWGQGYISCP